MHFQEHSPLHLRDIFPKENIVSNSFRSYVTIKIIFDGLSYSFELLLLIVQTFLHVFFEYAGINIKLHLNFIFIVLLHTLCSNFLRKEIVVSSRSYLKKKKKRKKDKQKETISETRSKCKEAIERKNLSVFVDQRRQCRVTSSYFCPF